MYVIDASVHVADARPREPHHAEARALLSQIAEQNRQVYLPEIVLAEIAAAISRGTGQTDLARRLTTSLRRVPNFHFVPVDQELGDRAADIAAKYQIPGCDAVYVALTQQLGAVLITLDHQQRVRVPHGIAARGPAEELGQLDR
jgi:predicted nucleic acid-binding protein